MSNFEPLQIIIDGIPSVSYKGSVLSYKHNNPLNQLLAASRQSVGQPVAATNNETATLEDSFGELLFDVISEKFKSQLKTGIPELEIPSLDPLKLNELKMQPTIGGDPYDIHLTNLKISGLSNFYLKDLTPKLTQLRFRISLLFPKLIADADYVVNGSIYEVFNVKGRGSATLEYTDVVLRTSVNLELKNGTLKVTTADPPMVDFANTKMMLKSADQPDKQNAVDSSLHLMSSTNMASELGPLLFWMLADHVVDEIDYYAAMYVNDQIKNFQVPESFKPMVTWLMRRRSPSGLAAGIVGLQQMGGFGAASGLPTRRFSPMSVLGEMVHILSQVKPGSLANFELPSALQNLRSSFRTIGLRRFLKKK